MEILVNGRKREVTPSAIESLADTLRDRLHLTGIKVSCGRGECGSCTVLLDGRPVYSCLTITNACAGASITVASRTWSKPALRASSFMRTATRCWPASSTSRW